MEGKGGPEDVKEEEKEGDTREGVKVEEGENTATKDVDGVISLEGKEEVGLQRKCLTGWINYQLSRHPRPPQGRVTDILHDLRSGLLLISLLEVKTKQPKHLKDHGAPAGAGARPADGEGVRGWNEDPPARQHRHRPRQPAEGAGAPP